ncbi:D-tagatose-bisphosphate aldolase, class II, non-catalytic subunit [Sinorhizobium medicae]|uniref:D-tagatose-bisphosphate aldolase, class II, non-catalytic subunit n=1 Tax=Sinorhizobium medicae TaxID=110321 RepID=UPI000C7B4CF6|nr:D-tagatose-bisphosphate aldolase, class II, non-catalytic subunit [Sinorhizobium medicae]MDX0543283.1 D-tagatose-bisphosphate aldolase, class II, non-catalytic subunit [Sinorhizobium medicae]MDX1100823.1 D-tagatose-bisphosphate aldolase, class II, non-catalytic subunit [Sinorhizobium medicae]MDX1152227.1 D-tagatose-bisphosphate aldolase, class II, non-catalytic subunit [Sinorhizobium medicae]PLU22398.1 D-tagatose-bisphosphate aldolase, class II, non-catalytic subunit [Sinorhizobium medicae]
MQENYLIDIARWSERPGARGIPSICSAHPLVIEAAMLRARREGTPVLIEATCNQVNQDGGYTGMTPADFTRFVGAIAHRLDFPRDRILLGGDHLGPNPWKHLPAEKAMAKAETMIEAYAKAGFTKLHLDTSMGCAGEPIALPDATTAARAARLAAVAEDAIRDRGGILPVYIIGTEVPIPGGALEELDVLEVTAPEAAIETVRVHREAFKEAGSAGAFGRVVGAVVQPGVEFGNGNVIAYDRSKAAKLSASLRRLEGMVFEAHSTDYQTREALRELVADGFAILKVGPGLTFALREALYGLDQIAAFLFPGTRERTLGEVTEAVMREEPVYWGKYYHGSADEQRIQRHFSYSDRIRYYWPHPKMAAAVDELMALLDGVTIPETLISQFLAGSYARVRDGEVAPQAKPLALAAIDAVLQDYFAACRL